MSSIKLPVTYLGKVRSGTAQFAIYDLVDSEGTVHPGTLDDRTEQAWRDMKGTELDAIGPYKLKPDTKRSNANVAFATALILDIDQTVVDLTEGWGNHLPHPALAACKHYVISSPSNLWRKEDGELTYDEKCYSWKVIYPLKLSDRGTGLAPDGLGKLQRSLVTLTMGTPVEVDRQTHDASRPCYRFQGSAPNFRFAAFAPDGPLLGLEEITAIVGEAMALDPVYVDRVKPGRKVGDQHDPTPHIIDTFRRKKGGLWRVLDADCKIWTEDHDEPTTTGALLDELVEELEVGVERDKLRGTLFGGSMERCLINVAGGHLIITDSKTGNSYMHRKSLDEAQALRDRPLPRHGRLDNIVAAQEMYEIYGDAIVADENGYPYLFDPETCTWTPDMSLNEIILFSSAYSGRLTKQGKKGGWTTPFGWTEKWGRDTAKTFTRLMSGSLEKWDEGLAFQDGVLTYEGEFRARRPSDHVITSDVLPYDYDANAGCPNWLKFLDEVIVKPSGPTGAAMLEMVQMYLGACLAGEAWRCNAMIVLYGGGANGKSVFLDVVQSMFSADNVACTPPDEWGDPNKRTALYGVKLNVVSDVGKARWKQTGVIKQILGGERVTMRHLYKDAFAYRPIAGHWFSLNALPSVWDDSTGWVRRCRVVPFLRHFRPADQDSGLTDRLKAELPGIALWALEGLRKIRQREYKLPHIDSGIWEAWNEGNKTSTVRFIDQWVRPGNTEYTSSQLLEFYLAFCRAEKDEPVKGNTFRKELKAKLIERRFPCREKRNRSGNQAMFYLCEHLEMSIVDGTFGS
jgi:P4 family phage/plasmid primase-like protien